MRFCDELDFGFGWIVDEWIARTSHVLAADGSAWIVDPLGWPDAEKRVRDLGEPRGVIQLLDRHNRDCAAVAERLDVPHYRVPYEPIAGAPFEFLRVARWRYWREVALWWPERRVLLCADALGTIAYFCSSRDRLGVHPFIRLWPPRRLGTVWPEHVLCGHGPGIHDGASEALQEALRTSRRRTLPAAIKMLRGS